MKVNLNPKQLDVENIAGSFDSIEAKIDTKSVGFMFEMLSKNLYSNPIGSLIREITSNCFDSHIEAGVDDAVVIKRGRDEEGIFISFNDFGVGLSPERIKNVYMNYFSSTKRETDSLIGGFGLGSKSPLSYTEYFYINTVFDKKKFNYIFSRGTEVPTLDLLNEEETEEKNGTEIRIYLKSDRDVYKFKDELKKQLCYFDNVYFDGWDIDNDYVIYESELFKYRNQDQYSDTMHIVFGKVSYPIDWEEIEMERIDVPVGIKFQIGELVVTPNRESLRYTDEVKVLVKERIKKTIEALIELFNKQNKVYYDFRDWYLNKDIKPAITFSNPNNGESDRLVLTGVKGIIKKQKFYLFEEMPIFYKKEDILDLLFEEKKFIFTGKENKYKDTNYSITQNYVYKTPYKYAIVENLATSGVKNYVFQRGSLLKSKSLSKDFKFDLFINQKRKNAYSEGKFGDGNNYFNLGVHKTLYKIIKHFKTLFLNYENLVDYDFVTKEQQNEFTEMNRNNNKALQRKLNKEILITNINGDSYNLKESSLEKITKLIIYGGYEDKVELQKAVTFLAQFTNLTTTKEIQVNEGGRGRNAWYRSRTKIVLDSKTCEVIIVSKENQKILNNLKKQNIMNVKNLYSNNFLFKRLASSLKIEDFLVDLVKFQSIDVKEYIKEITKICPEVGNHLNELYKYNRKYSSSEREILNSDFVRSDIKAPILELATKMDLFDENIEVSYKMVADWFKDVEIIKYTELNHKSLPMILKFLKQNKKKLELSYYQKYVDNTGHIVKGQLSLDFSEEESRTKFEVETEQAA